MKLFVVIIKQKNAFLGKFDDETIVKEESIMTALNLTTDDRPVVKACLEKAKKCKESSGPSITKW